MIPRTEQEENSYYIRYLSSFDPCSHTQCQKAKDLYENYKYVQRTLHSLIPASEIDTLTFGYDRKSFSRCSKQRLIQMKSTVCECCGNPLTILLQIHHKEPVSRGGSFGEDNLVILCPTCHCTVHKCVDIGGIDDSIRDYFETIGSLGKLEELVKKGIGD